MALVGTTRELAIYKLVLVISTEAIARVKGMLTYMVIFHCTQNRYLLEVFVLSSLLFSVPLGEV